MDAKRQIADVCLAASAAPFFLPAADIPNPDNAEKKEYFIDGGLWENNPTLIGLSEAKRKRVFFGGGGASPLFYFFCAESAQHFFENVSPLSFLCEVLFGRVYLGV